MMPRETVQDLIVDQALESEANLGVAIAVHASFEAIVERIVLKFLRELEQTLKTTLGEGWEIKSRFGQIYHEHHLLTLGKSRWVNACPIQLRVSKNLKEPYIGIWKKQKPFTILSPKDESALRDSLTEIFPETEHNDEWIAYWSVKSTQYRLWNEPQTLRNMYFRTGDFVSYYKEFVSSWAITVSSVIK